MKRFLLSVFFAVFSFNLSFTQEYYEKNLISRDVFSPEDITEINADLFQESFVLKTAKSESIYVEIFSNNSNKKPSVYYSSETETLNITKTSLSYDKGDFCSIIVYVPETYLSVTYKISTNYGNIAIENVNSDNSIVLNNCEGSTKINNCNCDYLYFLNNGQASEILFNNIKCSYFDISSIAGDISLSLTKGPEATSRITTKYGQINLTIPKTENFNLTVHSNNSKFINNYTKTNQTARNNRTFNNGTDGVPIFLQTFTGDITLNF